jgi:hypothetical protein
MGAHNQLQEEFVTEFTSLDPGNAGTIVCDRNQQQVEIVTAGAETRTLAAPDSAGVIMSIAMKTDGGDCVIATAVPFNQTGNNRITLNDTGDTVVLLAICKAGSSSEYRWKIVANDGASLTSV